jgi:transposase
VVATEDEAGPAGRPVQFLCQDVGAIRKFFERQTPFQCVIEASSSYRWLYSLLEPLGEVLLAHPLRLRALVSGRAKTDKLDAALLARLLKNHLIPTAYVPPRPYAELREVTRGRARLVHHQVHAKNELHALLARENLQVPYRVPFCKGGKRWMARVDLGPSGNALRDELLRRIEHFEREIEVYDVHLQEMAAAFPQIEALADLPGVGLYSALLIVAEIAEPSRFREGRQVGAYAGLTARVSQSGATNYHGHITKQGSPWLRWIFVQIAMRAARHDPRLTNFYGRIRKRSSAKIARVAVARKLATICWVRLMRWEKPQSRAA